MKALAQRYAAALADVAFERESAESVKQELAGFMEAFRMSSDLRNFLASPAVPKAAKQKVLESLGTPLGLSPAVQNFLFVIVDYRRTDLLEEIDRAFEAELHLRLGIADAHVTSARELTPQQRNELTQALEKVTGKKIEASYGLDAELIGGARVRIGSTIYDASVREQLNRLRAILEAE